MKESRFSAAFERKQRIMDFMLRELLVGFLVTLISISPTYCQCPGSSYDITTRGLPDTTAQPFYAWQGLPYFPDLETDNNRKYFWLDSGTDAAIFLHSDSQILNQEGEDYYQIILEQNGDAIIFRGETEVSRSPAANLLASSTWRQFYVEVNRDDLTIHLGKISAAGVDEGDVISWQDDTLKDINFILVQKFNDPVGDDALWEFCDGVVKLLTQNGATSQTMVATDRNDDSTNYRDDGVASNAIDGNTNEGLFDEQSCQILDHHEEPDETLKEHNWWRVDLQDMYDIKAVNIMNGQDYLCPREHRDWHYFGSACYFVVETPALWANAAANCQSYGGFLAHVTSPAINDFVKQWLTGSGVTGNYWIGLSDSGSTTGDYNWMGYYGFEYDDHFTDYLPPTTPATTPAASNCVQMQSADSFLWDIVDCTSATANYICQVPQCDNGWVLFGTTCYYVSNTEETFENARTTCHADNIRGELATINSTFIQVFFTTWLRDVGFRPYWVGLKTGDNNNAWYWDASGVPKQFFEYYYYGGANVDGYPIDNAFEYWENNEPDAGADNCGMAYVSGGVLNGFWYDVGCANRFWFVCQRLPTIPQQLETAEIRIGSCGPPVNPTLTDVELHDTCSDTNIGTSDVDQERAGYWLFRECDQNHYGQYVYIFKKKTNAEVTWFSLCEVEVWGIELDDANKQHIGFTQEVVSDLEADITTVSVTVTKTGGSVEHPTCYSYTLGVTEITAEDGGTPDDYGHDAILGTYVLPGTQEQRFLPNGPHSYTFTVTVNDDTVSEEDEQFLFFIDSTSPGLLIADSTEPTYADITFTIENDDVVFCWDTSTISARENSGQITAILRRTGYTTGQRTAYVSTEMDDVSGGVMATADEDYESLPTLTAVVFEADELEKDVVITLLDDTSCETDDTMDETFKLILEAESEGNLCDTADATDDYVIATILHDDATYSLQVIAFAVNESVGEFEIAVERIGYQGYPSMVGVKTEPDTPESATTDDYTGFNTILDFAIGSSVERVTMVIDDDSLVEEDEEIFDVILVESPSTLPPCVLDPVAKVATVNITDNDSFVVNSEGTSTEEGVFPATTGVDFTSSTSTTVTIPSNETTAMQYIDILDDDVYEESDEFFDVILQSTEDGVIVEPSSVRIKIQDNDVVIGISGCTATSSVLESGGKYTATVERRGSLLRTDSIILYTEAGTASSNPLTGDYEDVRSVISFTAGQETADQEITIHDDHDQESDETFTVYIQTQGHESYVDPAADTCVVTILDDDCTFSFSVAEDDMVVTEAVGGVDVPVTITRDGNVDRAASIVLSTSPLTTGAPDHHASFTDDYVSVSKTLTFLSDESTKVENIHILDDNKPEVREFFLIGISNADCSIDIADNIIIGIEDNDEVIIYMREDSITVDETVGYAYVTLLKTGSLSRTDIVTLQLRSAAIADTSSAATPGSDFRLATITVEFKVDEDEQTASVQIYDDTIEEPGLESLVMRIVSVAQQSDEGPSVLDAVIDDDRRETIVYIRDNDGIFLLTSTSRTVSESVGSVTVYVERTGPAQERQTAYLSTADGSATAPADYKQLSGEALVFEPNVKTMSYTLWISNDQELEPSEDFFIYLSTDLGTDIGQRVTLIAIEDDDFQIKLVVFPTPMAVTTDSSISVMESIGTARVTIQRSGYGLSLPTGDSSVRIKSRTITMEDPGMHPANQSDFTSINEVLTFQPGQSTQDIFVTIADDSVGEETEVFELYLSDPAPYGSNVIVYPDAITFYILDDDGGVPPTKPPDGGDGTGDGGDTTIGTPALVGIGGGVGLLLLISVLGLVACIGLTRTSKPGSGASLPLTRPTPRGPPPAYYQANPAAVQFRSQTPQYSNRVLRY